LKAFVGTLMIRPGEIYNSTLRDGI